MTLSAALGPARRYRAFLAVRRGDVPVVIGTRAAMFAPVARLGLVAIWDDGDDLHAEPRAPYPHAREVLLTRARLGEAAALVGGWTRTAEGQLLVETGWAREVVADRATLRARTPAIAPTGDDPQLARDPGAATARLPSLAWTTARDTLRADAPVLVQVPRRGYLPSVSCADCRTPARCPHCAGPLALPAADAPPACRWCGRVAAAYACPQCGGRRLRAAVTGARRTAEELGRAFPGVPVRTSGRDEVLTDVPAGAGLVVATPGAEPVAEGGTARSCCWTPGPCSPGPICGPARRPCAGGCPPRPWPDPLRPVGRWWWSPTARSPRCRRCCAGTPAGSPPGSWPSAGSWVSPRR